MKISHQLLLGMASVLMAITIQAENFEYPPQQQPAASGYVGYIGVIVDKVPEWVRAHYPNQVAAIPGLIVIRFPDDSPAADDGIKLYDVLLTYDDKPIQSPQTFFKRVSEVAPGHVAKIEVLRQGQLLTVPVTMGKRKVGQRRQNFAPGGNPSNAGTNKSKPGSDFNGLAIRKIGENVYDASIGIVAPDGSRQRRSFKGTREQILQQIMQARDLPQSARQQLIFAVKPKKKSSGWGGMPGMPFGNDSKFNPSRFFKGWGF